MADREEGGTSGTVIDASGTLLDGTKISGPVELRKALMKNRISSSAPDRKADDLRAGPRTDELTICRVRAIVREAARNDYRFRQLILGVVRSAPFQCGEAGEKTRGSRPRRKE